MSVDTSTSTSSSGSTTTVGATVRDSGGPGGGDRIVDVHLLIEPAKMTHVATGSPSPTPTAHDSNRLSVWWSDLTLKKSGKLDFTYKVTRRSGNAFEGAVEGTLVVSDRSKGTLYVKRFSLCPLPRSKFDLPFLGKKSKSAKSRRAKSRAR